MFFARRRRLCRIRLCRCRCRRVPGCVAGPQEAQARELVAREAPDGPVEAVDGPQGAPGEAREPRRDALEGRERSSGARSTAFLFSRRPSFLLLRLFLVVAVVLVWEQRRGQDVPLADGRERPQQRRVLGGQGADDGLQGAPGLSPEERGDAAGGNGIVGAAFAQEVREALVGGERGPGAELGDDEGEPGDLLVEPGDGRIKQLPLLLLLLLLLPPPLLSLPLRRPRPPEVDDR